MRQSPGVLAAVVAHCHHQYLELVPVVEYYSGVPED